MFTDAMIQFTAETQSAQSSRRFFQRPLRLGSELR